MEVARVSQQPFTVVEGGSPGLMLKSARERMGLTIGDVCANLKMTEKQIKAMESDTLVGLPPGGYGRAFIKGYARFVGLDADLIVESMLATGGESSPLGGAPQLLISPSVAAQRAQDEAEESGDGSVRSAPVTAHYHFAHVTPANRPSEGDAVKYSLIALVIGLLAYIVVPTLKDKSNKEEPSVSQIPQEVAIPAVNAELMPSNRNQGSTGVTTEPAFAPGTVLMPAQTQVPESQALVPMVQSVTTPAPLPPVSVVRPSPALVQPKPVAAPVPATQVVVPPVAAAPTASLPVSASPALAGGQKVRIQFVDRAYVTVRDRDGNVLLAQLNPANTDKVIEGNPPFRVIIGNAKAVKMEYKGKPLDLSTYTKDDVARFVIE